jgi:hypothetical protein
VNPGYSKALVEEYDPHGSEGEQQSGTCLELVSQWPTERQSSKLTPW